jgi:hypothetical protein
VTFDPFGDFATRGYLRNFESEKDPEIVRRLQHTAFTLGLDADVATNEVLGEADEPSVKAKYEAVVAKRKRAEDG